MCDAAGLLFDALATNSTLTELKLAKNQIGALGADKAATALAREGASLAVLDLYDNNIGCSVGALAEVVRDGNSSLTNLDLYKNQITDAGMSQLASALASNVTLSTLNVSGNGFQPGGAASEQLAAAFRTRPPPAAGAFNLLGVKLCRHSDLLELPPSASKWGNEEVLAVLWERRRRRVVAFAMALHPRLGSRALGRHLDDNMLRLICKASHL
jgi:hypothetical protein